MDYKEQILEILDDWLDITEYVKNLLVQKIYALKYQIGKELVDEYLSDPILDEDNDLSFPEWLDKEVQ